MRRYQIEHCTTVRYAQSVRASHNELRMTPTTESTQTTLDSRIEVHPLTWSLVYRDHWGTQVTSIECNTPHTVLDIAARSTVETHEYSPETTANATWESLQNPEFIDEHYDFLAIGPRTEPEPQLTSKIQNLINETTPAAAIQNTLQLIVGHMTYQQGVTGVRSRAREAWEHSQGVCQDFAHITIGALRTLGIPARYVSGYMVPTADLSPGSTVTGQSHAWVEYWNGSWIAIDPTNISRPVSHEHIVVARGRNYDDVAPFLGVYDGTKEVEQEVSVTFTRML